MTEARPPYGAADYVVGITICALRADGTIFDCSMTPADAARRYPAAFRRFAAEVAAELARLEAEQKEMEL